MTIHDKRFFALFVVLISSAISDGFSQSGPSLDVSITATYTLPQSYRPDGAIRYGDSVLAWSTETPFLLLLRRDSVRTLRLPTVNAPVGVSVAHDTLVVFDRDPARLLRFVGTRLISIKSLRIQNVVERAIPALGGWVISSRDSLGRTAIHLWKQTDELEVLSERFVPRSGAEIVLQPVLGGGFLSYLRGYPFEVYGRTGTSRDVWFVPDIEAELTSKMYIGQATSLRATGLVPIDTVLVHSLFDAENVVSHLRVYSSRGKLMRSRLLPGDLAFLSVIDGGKTIVGTRQLEKRELVLFQWRWGRVASARKGRIQ
ncbi:MAG: hypothetical protein WEE89_18650 [Gemmatimonadota bacterium]